MSSGGIPQEPGTSAGVQCVRHLVGSVCACPLCQPVPYGWPAFYWPPMPAPSTISDTYRLLQAVDQKLNQVLGKLENAERRLKKMSRDFDAAMAELQAEVAPLDDAVVAVGALLDRLVTMVEENADSPDAVRAVTASFRAEKDKLVASTLAHTPAEPPA